MYVITGLNEAQIDGLVRSRASFEINGCGFHGHLATHSMSI
ncbi:hypothetical protein N0387_30435 [Pseudomonas aeruginosa]|nr:hypothetical protein [Pseudomonas aeruginosa]MCS7852769.1 hypothetical protein [Pseudomonas aeruginosa]